MRQAAKPFVMTTVGSHIANRRLNEPTEGFYRTTVQRNGSGNARMLSERRQNIRYAVTDGDLVVTDVDSDKVAIARDISAGGMQIQYMPERGGAAQWRLLSFLAGNYNRMVMSDIRCRVVYDIPALMENGTFSGLNVRLSGLAFTHLTVMQKALLHQLLARNAAGRRVPK